MVAWLKRMKRLALLLIALMMLLCGCRQRTAQTDNELWIMTEKSTWDRMNGQLHVLEEAYLKEHGQKAKEIKIRPVADQQQAFIHINCSISSTSSVY